METFLLNPRYSGSLESEEFRTRFRAESGLDGLAAFPLAFFVSYNTVSACLLIIGVFLVVYWFALSGFICDICVACSIGVWLLYLAFLIWFTTSTLRRRRDLRRLADHGQLLTGDIVNCAGEVFHSEYGRSPEERMYFNVTVRYRARLPNGAHIEGSASRVRDDLISQALPGPGTPVIVLACDERLHQML